MDTQSPFGAEFLAAEAANAFFPVYCYLFLFNHNGPGRTNVPTHPTGNAFLFLHTRLGMKNTSRKS